MLSIKHLVLLITLYGVTVGQLNPFRSDYTYHSTIDGWLKLHIVPGTWHDARQRCNLEGAILASPVNADMLDSLDSEMNKSSTKNEGIYTAVHSLFSKGYFYSTEGVPLTKMPVQWLPGEPDNAGNNEDCIVYVDGRVADGDCSEVYQFVCYKERTDNMSITECGTIDTRYEFSAETGSCYKFHKTPRNWTEAFKVCSAEGGYLAVFNSKEEATVVNDIYLRDYPNSSEYDMTYLGILDWNRDQVWRTVHGPNIRLVLFKFGEEMMDIFRDRGQNSSTDRNKSIPIRQTLEEAGYADWKPGQPDNGRSGEYCGAMYPSGMLNDYECFHKAKFMCEKDPKSLQDYSPPSVISSS